MLAKNWMTGLREDAMSQLCAQGVLVPKRERAMHEQVTPWLMGQIMGFLEEEEAIFKGIRRAEERGRPAATQSGAASSISEPVAALQTTSLGTFAIRPEI